MFERTRQMAVVAALAWCAVMAAPAVAADAVWQVSKASGDVWVVSSGAQQVSLGDARTLQPGQTIRTGRNGRVLLVRGKETMLISPNSDVGLPAGNTDGMATTITQRAGSILLEVEKRNVRNFAVETPYLAAVVKGTQFRVSVDGAGSRVDVVHGSVQVADFKTGQYALVFPGQAARVAVNGRAGLSLSGKGQLSPIRQGQPRAAPVDRLPVPARGLQAPGGDGQRVRALGAPDRAGPRPPQGERRAGKGALRIHTAIGDVKLNFQKVTKGLARGPSHAAIGRRAAAATTVWNTDALTPGNGVGKAYAVGNGNGNAGANGLAKGKGNNGVGNPANNGVGNGNGLALGHDKDHPGKGKGKGHNKS